MYTEDNRLEIPDKTPVVLPLGYRRPESLQQMIARMVQVHSLQAANAGMESFEEADDFEMEEEENFVSPHQMTDMQEENLYVRERDGSGTKRSEDKSGSKKGKKGKEEKESVQEDAEEVVDGEDVKEESGKEKQ